MHPSDIFAFPKNTADRISELPCLSKRSQVHLEGPSRPVLPNEHQCSFGNRVRLHEELIWLTSGEVLPGISCINHSVDHQIGDVDALRAKLLRKRLRQDTLRRFGWRKCGCPEVSTNRGRRSRNDDCAPSPLRQGCFPLLYFSLFLRWAG
jgi:hypothetical protein